jgi:hypothetical protein
MYEGLCGRYQAKEGSLFFTPGNGLEHSTMESGSQPPSTLILYRHVFLIR